MVLEYIGNELQYVDDMNSYDVLYDADLIHIDSNNIHNENIDTLDNSEIDAYH